MMSEVRGATQAAGGVLAGLPTRLTRERCLGSWQGLSGLL